jgi:hypothetical protein
VLQVQLTADSAGGLNSAVQETLSNKKSLQPPDYWGFGSDTAVATRQWRADAAESM